MTKTINYMTTEQCLQLFQTNEMQKVYEVELASVDTEDIDSVQRFLDEEAYDVMRLDRSQCDLLNLDYETGYYVDTWKGQYLS